MIQHPKIVQGKPQLMPALLEKLEAAGVWIDPKRDDSGFGRFAWIRDVDGNRVELWEPKPKE